MSQTELNPRETKIVALVKADVEAAKRGKEIKPYRLPLTSDRDPVDIRAVAQALHEAGIHLDQYIFDETIPAHIFIPRPYEPIKPVFNRGRTENPFGDLFGGTGFADFFDLFMHGKPKK
ncbi:MAG: hypothetical protein Q7S31_03360 [bacterium]|nr:hypothetical protein [bacterium]